MDDCLLHYADRDFVIINAPSLAYSHRVHQYHRVLLEEVAKCTQNVPLHPFNQETEAMLYSRLTRYYKKVALTLEHDPINLTAIDCDRLSWESRLQFFVCTEPVELQDGTKVLGLSWLSQLLGCSIPTGDSPPPPEQTTGRSDLDILVDTLLVFKARAWKLTEQYSTEQLSRMLVQANYRMKPPDEDKKPTVRVGASGGRASTDTSGGRDLDVFIQKKDAITGALSAMNVELPEGW